ncbi:MAG: InlB B-repeat-containing protein, partial [Clostridia bacterium]|nr:InlB B-repeat-containing protein [Clostridia bacterium]
YRFDGWFIAKDGDTEFDFSETKITSDITVYAHWVEVVTVTFNFNYEGAPETQTLAVDKGNSLQEANAPAATREGFIFNGWHTGETEESAYSFGSEVTASFTLFAHWTAIEDGKTTYHVTFDYNYFAYENRDIEIVEGNKVSKPQDPEGSGRTFDGWYTELEGGSKYDFDSAVTGDFTLYAHWKIEQYIVTFNYVIDGNTTTLRTRKVSPGGSVSAGNLPTVDGYRFANEWYTDAEYTTKFDFSKPVNADYNLYIKPLKENKFEAEYTYIDENKAGVGSSDNFNGLKLIFIDNGTASASNGYWVSGLYYNTAFIEFIITSDTEVTDAHLQLRLSAEWADMYLAPTNQSFGGDSYYGFEISCAPALLDSNGQPQKDNLGYTLFDTSKKLTFDYAPIAMTGAISFEQSMVDKRPFTDYLMTTTFTLREGVNVIRLTVTNSNPPYDGTMEASAPMIDRLSIFTDATLTWNPLTENIADRSKLNA